MLLPNNVIARTCKACIFSFCLVVSPWLSYEHNVLIITPVSYHRITLAAATLVLYMNNGKCPLINMELEKHTYFHYLKNHRTIS